MVTIRPRCGSPVFSITDDEVEVLLQVFDLGQAEFLTLIEVHATR